MSGCVIEYSFTPTRETPILCQGKQEPFFQTPPDRRLVSIINGRDPKFERPQTPDSNPYYKEEEKWDPPIQQLLNRFRRNPNRELR